MVIDLPTLGAATAFATAVSGTMLVFSWWQDRKVVTLGLWGAALILLTLGGALLLLRGSIPHSWSIPAGGGLCVLAYGLTWCGARAFEERRVAAWQAGAGVALWLICCLFEAFLGSTTVRVQLFSLLAGGYSLLTASEYARARDKELMSRWPAIVLLLVHASLYAIRAAFAEVLLFPSVIHGEAANWISIGAAGLMAHNYCMAFLVMTMAKERAELRHRRAALIDPLTGIANRRAFFARGERLLARIARDGRAGALLVLDLDLFKRINDTFGHQAGDRVLCAFCDTASRVLRSTDLFGRTGGEEFACLIPDVSQGEAFMVAERIRSSFARRSIDLGAVAAGSTVSIGVAASSEAGYDLAALMAAADRALYQAKANGRNRVEPARPAPAPPTCAAAIA
jgi:diguanylate cyclase (GGDEF)-like protein